MESTKKEKDRSYTKIPNYIVRSDDPSNVVRVLCVIASFAWEGSACTASANTIGRHAKTSRGTVFAAIKLWEARGQIRVDRSNPRGLRIVTTFDYQFNYMTDAPWVDTKLVKQGEWVKKIVPIDARRDSSIGTPPVFLGENAYSSHTNTTEVSNEEHKQDQEKNEKKHTQEDRIENEQLGCAGENNFFPGQVAMPIPNEAERLCRLFASLNINPRITYARNRFDAEECLATQPFQFWSDLLHRYAICKEKSEKDFDRWLPTIGSPKELLEKYKKFLAYEERSQPFIATI